MTVDEAIEYFKSRGFRSRIQEWSNGSIGLHVAKQSTLKSGGHTLQVIDLAAYIFLESDRWGVWWPAETRDRPAPQHESLLAAVNVVAERLDGEDTQS